MVTYRRAEINRIMNLGAAHVAPRFERVETVGDVADRLEDEKAEVQNRSVLDRAWAWDRPCPRRGHRRGYKPRRF